MENKTDKTAFWSNLGEGISVALIILALCFGIGGCNYFVQKGAALNKAAVAIEKNK